MGLTLPEVLLIMVQPRSDGIRRVALRKDRPRDPTRAVYSGTMVNRHSREARPKDEHRYEDLESRSGSSCERV